MSDDKPAKAKPAKAKAKATHYVWTGGPLGGAILCVGFGQCYHAGAVLAGSALAEATASQPAYVEQRPGEAEPTDPEAYTR